MQRNAPYYVPDMSSAAPTHDGEEGCMEAVVDSDNLKYYDH